MRRLILMRHAKSSWDHPGLLDSERPLNQRGRLASTLMGGYFSEVDLKFDTLLLSSARRVQETWGRMSLSLRGRNSRVETRDELYMASVEQIMDALRTLPPECEDCLLIAHQPSLSEFLHRVCTVFVPHVCSAKIDKFPTAAMAEIELPIPDWGALAPSLGRCVSFVSPKDLV